VQVGVTNAAAAAAAATAAVAAGVATDSERSQVFVVVTGATATGSF
jgi:hypothetical protein